jgi:hypothetical protein
MTGIEMIAKELKEAREKHGFDVLYDQENNSAFQLRDAARYMLTGDEYDYPLTWGREWKTKFDRKLDAEKLVLAAVFIAAELDRLNAKNEEKQGS